MLSNSSGVRSDCLGPRAKAGNRSDTGGAVFRGSSVSQFFNRNQVFRVNPLDVERIVAGKVVAAIRRAHRFVAVFVG